MNGKMGNIIRLESISQLNALFQQTAPKHPLISVVDFSKIEKHEKVEEIKLTCGFYSVMFKNHCANKLKYGKEYYDFQEGTLMCIAPNQIITIENDANSENADIVGWGLFFHPDLIRGTSLGNKIKEYTFFSYEINEALHLSDKEKQTLWDCVDKLENELSENIDLHSQTLITSNIELLLNYCARYYDRQFITRKKVNTNLLTKFETILNSYFNSNDQQYKKLPSVKYFAELLFLSPNYLSDLLKKETGKTAQEYLHYYLIEEAKNNLLNTNDPINEIAFNLGFEYPQYFSKLFKSKTGMTPIAYRNMN
ncbi:MAG: helix-turn-helix transcriptional regulator [Saprospiraceae bacterium]|nr:helix-turn-helix transcriptional regulator [Saprospiraceae bacterium]MDP4699739.1 helix-turn-helix transcriptional regulator [Saprospiraceae bacterium]MDP4815273.1 helix-turn-helix transcriptional regulator [Saprospiraceae bacterium]MDP4913617.1 helix-turn-helix transcriptional regulator [Saprospiraceae bacterium]MDP5049594.1 helix-turn-helix transcriptional regulator [Saprospiraceae bacterium]